MPAIRAFIAIEIPSAIHAQLDNVAKELRSQVKNQSIHWVAAQNIHLTLKFLGEVSAMNLEAVKELIKVESANHSHFEINIGGIGSFPNPRRPRVIWIGIKAPAPLMSLQKGIETEVQKLGYSPEDRGFSPHLTLARISHAATSEEIKRVSEVLSKCKVGHLGTIKVDSIRLFKSDLLPGGPVYTPLFTAALSPDSSSLKVNV